MYGQMTAGSWIYIGTQGILQGTYETLAAVAQRHFGGNLTGRTVVTAGLGGMGGAQPLAATMNGASALVVEVDPSRIARRVQTGYLDESASSLDEALERLQRAAANHEARSIGLEGNAADVLPALAARGVTPDVVTDQTSAHDALNGYVPNGMSLQAALALRSRDPEDYVARSVAAMGRHVEAMLALKRRGSVVFDYGNNIRAQAVEAGRRGCVRHPGVRARVHSTALLRRQGALPLGGALRDPADIAATDRAVLEMFPQDDALARWIRLAQTRVQFQGLPGPHLLAWLR
jgi:urocanate hydratase